MQRTRGAKERTIYRTGGSLVVALPPDLLRTLDMGEGSAVEVVLDPERRALVVQSATPTLPGVDPAFLQVVDSVLEEYRDVFEELSRR